MRIQHNIMAMNAYRNYSNNTSALSKNLEKLSSGYKINRAGDDAAGLAISEKMRAQITGLEAAQKNVKDGISLINTAEGALQEVQNMLNRMVYLATESANGTFDSQVDRVALQDEVDQLLEEIDRIHDAANFNGITLLNGDYDDGTIALQHINGNGGSSSTDDSTASGAPTATKDNNNAAKLGTVTVAYADGITDAQKTKVNDALKGDFKFKTTDAGTAGTWDAGDKIQIDKLPTGLTAKIKAQDGTTDLTITAATDLEVGTGNDKIDATKDLAIDLYDGNTKVATITVGKPTAGATGTTTVTFAAAEASKAAKAGEGSETTEAKKYGGDLTIAADAVVAANDTIKIGSKTYTAKSGDDTGDNIDIDSDAKVTTVLAEAISRYNDEAGEDFTAKFENGKITFTAKTGKTPTAAPNFSITIANATNSGKVEAGPIKEVTAADGDTTPTGNGKGMRLQIGDTSDSFNQLNVVIGEVGTTKLEINGIKITDADKAGAAIGVIKDAINYVSSVRGRLGAYSNRLDHTANNLSVMRENIQDAESSIRDTDVAEEMMAYTKNNILVQSAQAMLAQANQVPQGVLQLLQ